MRAAVTALAPLAVIPVAPVVGVNVDASAEPESKSRSIARYLWAMLLARIYEAFPLSCPICHNPMRIIAFINDTTTLHKILNHLGESTQPPKIAQARGPPLWEAANAVEQAAEKLGNAEQAQWDLPTPPESPIEFDQRIGW